MKRSSLKATSVTYEAEVRTPNGPWHLYSGLNTLESAKQQCKEALAVGYAAVRILKVTREELP